MADVRTLDLTTASACAAWDAFVRAHADGTAFHLTAWGRAIQKAMGHKAHYLAAFGGQDIVGVLPLIHVATPLFGSSLISNAFAVYGGPLADDDDVHAQLDAAAWDLAQRCRAPTLEYRNQRRMRAAWPAKAETYATFRRALGPNSEENLKAIPRKQRAEVRKSLDLGLSVVIDRDADRHFQVYAESVRNLGTPVFSRKLFHALLEVYGPDTDILTVMHDGQPVASVLSLYFRNEVIPYYGGGVEAARALRANDHMYWMLMEHARERGCTSFDFGRSKLGTGAFAFKKNWGFEPQPLIYEYRLANGNAVPDINPLNPKYKLMTRVWEKLPLAVANRIGPMIARGLG